ncbi:phosphotransferase family protein [uncultured Enterovirga sp.]|uniref:phosphotransferase family protein n=1 Tax=uncultured Enterovirga sp. TaxID=2026352 RepID=UPI0035CA13BA
MSDHPNGHDAPALGAEEAQRLAEQVLTHLLGSPPSSVRPLGGGLTNFVFEAEHPDGALVVRMSATPSKVKEYLKEQWAMARAREQGVPVPEVLEVGTEPIPFPYMVSRKVSGVEGTHHPDRFRVLREMGRYAKMIHSVPTNGFGHTFDWSENRLSRKDTWADYLEREFQGEQKLSLLERHQMLAPPALEHLRATLRDIEGWKPDPVLNHGDLRLKNVIAAPDGQVVALLDWEFCTSNAAPYWDLSLALHDLSVDAKEQFLAGYGMTPREVMEAAPALRAFNVLNYAVAVNRAADERDRPTLDRLRMRLQGGLDLYAF